VKLLIGIAVAVVALMVGFAAGLEFEKLRHARADVQQLLDSDFREQRSTTLLSLAVFEKLQTDDPDKVNSLLGRQLALYYRFYKDADARSPNGPCLVPLIEKAATRSPAVKAELEKQSP
jgi:hypothetical protein